MWTTRGTRFHKTADCPGIKDGQAKAQEEGKLTYAPVARRLAEVPTDHEACLRCWDSEPSRPVSRDVETARASLFGIASLPDADPSETLWERKLRDRVLPALRSLGEIRQQVDVPRRLGAPLRVDFAFYATSGHRFAIEVDGDKNDHDGSHRNYRDAELRDLGWEPIHLSNRQVASDPDWSSAEIRRHVERTQKSLALDTRPPTPTTTYAVVREVEPPRTAPSSGRSVQPSNRAEPARSKTALAVGAIVAALVGAVTAGLFLLREDDSGGVEPNATGTCDSAHPVKGNLSFSGDRIYHVPEGEYYEATDPEVCFVDAAAAESAGYRRSQR